ncbi:cytochrome c biogenesis CcdA family protein [Microbacterium sp. MPKO10]|uniref:cytochrome c biogenesis CcdA family protein n=1 Tax=Microbacterium sp. MPKO10 TaxID=2989818 RepID=UPI0022361D67|nr:cytochrome c biogenesis CcdA family protein [Microbacterium sp. MPKO10]MCW4458956.1 cytochrome c biogenesis CcdA family protein [Microbacterium sp. MPKO10]
MDIGYAGAFLGGILALLSPCSVMLLPAFFAYAFAAPLAILVRTAQFFAGLLVTLVPLGVFSAALGSLVTENRTVLVGGAAVVVIIAGLVQLLGIPVPGLSRTTSGSTERTSAVSVFLLGAVYAVAGVCAGPILGSVLAVAALGGNPVYGGIMLAFYGLGMVVPLVILALLWKRFGARVSRLIRPRMLTIGRWQNAWSLIVSGSLTIAIGVLLLITNGTANLGGIVTVDTQYQAESWVTEVTDGISNIWFVLGAVAVAGVVALGVMAATRHRRSSARSAETPSDRATEESR